MKYKTIIPLTIILWLVCMLLIDARNINYESIFKRPSTFEDNVVFSDEVVFSSEVIFENFQVTSMTAENLMVGAELTTPLLIAQTLEATTGIITYLTSEAVEITNTITTETVYVNQIIYGLDAVFSNVITVESAYINTIRSSLIIVGDLTVGGDIKGHNIKLVTPTGGKVIINEAGLDVDFRIESNNNAYNFFSDGGNDCVFSKMIFGEIYHHDSTSETSITYNLNKDVWLTCESFTMKNGQNNGIAYLSAEAIEGYFLSKANNQVFKIDCHISCEMTGAGLLHCHVWKFDASEGVSDDEHSMGFKEDFSNINDEKSVGFTGFVSMDLNDRVWVSIQNISNNNDCIMPYFNLSLVRVK